MIPKQINTAQPPVWISNSINRFYRGVETEDFIYYVCYTESDENGNTVMYRKSDGELVSDNYFASEDLFGVLVGKKYTWLSKSMAYNAAVIQKENPSRINLFFVDTVDITGDQLIKLYATEKSELDEADHDHTYLGCLTTEDAEDMLAKDIDASSEDKCIKYAKEVKGLLIPDEYNLICTFAH